MMLHYPSTHAPSCPTTNSVSWLHPCSRPKRCRASDMQRWKLCEGEPAEERVLVASSRDLRQEELWRRVESAMRFSSRHYRTIVRRPSRSPPNGSQPPGHNSHSLRVGFAPARIRVFRNSSPRPSRGALLPVVEATTRSTAATEHAARATLSSVPFASVSL